MEKPLLALVAIIALAVTCLATTQPAQSEDQIKQESLPDYSYVYEIKDDSGEGYGKTESRSGEQANGQYYVNSNQATTSVDYTADEWGYHPFIKYAAALGPGTSSSTHFILGETALKNFRVYEAGAPDETKAHQIIQPYTLATGDAPLTDKSNLNSNSSIARILEQDHDINYVNFVQQPSREGIPSDGNPQGEASSISAAGVLSNNISEDQLVVETAGNFGQRVDEIKIPLASGHRAVSVGPIDPTSPRPHREQKSAAQKQEDRRLEQHNVGTNEQQRRTENGSTFSKPIVVADVEEPVNNYPGEEIGSTSPDPEALPFVSNRVSFDDANDLTTSALVLNPIQAGVSLVNAGKTHLIDTNFTGSKDPAPVVERIEDDHEDYLEYDSTAYESIQSKVGNNNVEIQKSVEMYHPMPSQEIHYPPQMPEIERLQEYPGIEETWNSQRINAREPVGSNYEDRDDYRTSGTNKHEYTSSKQNGESDKDRYLYDQKDGGVGYDVEVTPSKVYQLVDYKVQHQNQYDLKYQQQPIYNQYPMSFEKPEKRLPYVPEKEIPLVNSYFPYRVPVEKVVEKPIPVPQPIPITVQKIIEKKIPVPVQKIVPQPYPVHVPVPQPVPVPIPVEKIVEKKIPIPQPYPVEVEKIIEKKVPVPVEVTKVVEKPIAVNIKSLPYNFPFSLMYQPGLRNHDHIYNHLTPAVSPSSSIYVTIPNNQSNMPFQSFHLGAPKNNLNQNYQNYNNGNQNNYQNMQNQHGQVNPMIGHSKKVPVYYTVPSNLLTYTLFNSGARRKPMKEIYIGPVPPEPKPLQQNMNMKIQRKAPNQSIPKTMTTLPTRPPMQVTVSYRKARQDSPFPNAGNFRQSKIEYGFKPPMVPSIQYDEETGSKVASR